MATENSNGKAGGIGLPMILFLIFLVLKLCKVIDWSWWWVTAPLWGLFALLTIVLMIVGLIKLARG
jgi:phosphoglycerol transferase MdoB-like AlkP superfamily enzyme